MKRLLVVLPFALFAFGHAPPCGFAADPTIVSALAFPSIRSEVSIAKAYDPSRDRRVIVDDLRQVDLSGSPGVTEFDQTITSFARDPGGPTILVKEPCLGFDPNQPSNGVIGPFFTSSVVSQDTHVTATADTATVTSSGSVTCRSTRLPCNGLMGSNANGRNNVVVKVTISRACRYAVNATIAVDGGGSPGSAAVGFSGPNEQHTFTSSDLAIDRSTASATRSMQFRGVYQPGQITMNIGADLTNAAPQAHATWSVSLTLVPDGPRGPDIRWTDPSGGGFGTAANWDPPQVPLKDASHTDTAVFDLDRTYAVDFGISKAAAQRTSDRLVIDAGHVTFENANYKVDGLSLVDPSLVVDAGTLTLASGDLTCNSANIGDLHSVGAAIEVTGQDSRWDCLGRLRVGGSSGGSGAPGNLTITRGAIVASAESLVGAGGQTGNVAVNGGGSRWTTGNMHVGFTSRGDVAMTDGAAVASDTVLVGGGFSTTQFASSGFPGASVRVAGVDASGTPTGWDTMGLTLGQGATVSVEDGGRLGATEVGIFGSGTVSVTGVNAAHGRPSLLACNEIEVGSDGVLDVAFGGDVEIAAGNLSVGTTSLGTGTVNVLGSAPTAGPASTLHVDG
jgi:T5SS/PEP-CTERM-associated repeat protein